MNSNSLVNQSRKPKFSVAIQSDTYKNLINNTLGDKEIARQFVADITAVVSNNPMLSQCDAGSIISAGLLAQSLKLSLASSLGFAYIVPYKDKAQLQVGWKGLVQLAQRTGQFKRLGVRPVHDGEYIGQDEFGDDLFKFDHKYDNEKTVGYFAYFELTNGFVKTMYWTKEQCEKHARKYSRSYGTGKSTDLWSNSFDDMACKTVLKLLLNRFAPLSIEMQKGLVADQAVVNTNGSYEYVDNTPIEDEIVEEKPKLAEKEAPKKERKTKVKANAEDDPVASFLKQEKENTVEEINEIEDEYDLDEYDDGNDDLGGLFA